MRDATAASLIESVTSPEFERLNPHARDADRVEVARLMADRAELSAEEREKVEAWARDLLARPSVRVILTEAEWDRLRRRVAETFDGDRGAALGLTQEDRDLLHRLAIEVQRPKADVSAEVATWEEHGIFPLHASSAIDAVAVRIISEAAQRAAVARRECRTAVEAADYKLRDVLSEYGYSPEDPVLAEAVSLCREAKERVEAALEAFDRLDLRARGIDTEMLRTRLEENAGRAREREQKNSRGKKERRKHPLLERMRLRRRTAKYGAVLPAPARAAMERPPATAEDHTRVRAIDADARRLVALLGPEETRSPVAGLGAALLALERAILKVYDPLDPLSAGYAELTDEQRIAARDLLSRIHRRNLVVTTADPWTLRLLLHWITDQAACFNCQRVGWACECIHDDELSIL